LKITLHSFAQGVQWSVGSVKTQQFLPSSLTMVPGCCGAEYHALNRECAILYKANLGCGGDVFSI